MKNKGQTIWAFIGALLLLVLGGIFYDQDMTASFYCSMVAAFLCLLACVSTGDF